MPSKKPTGVSSAEITPERTYLSRRAFTRAAVLAGTTTASGLLYRALMSPTGSDQSSTTQPTTPAVAAPRTADVPGESPTPLDDIANYNNFYEFSTDKREVAFAARGFVATPWTVAVDGLVHRPKIYDLDALKRLAPPEERVYRMRCVEGWSMVIPWLGFPLSAVLDDVQPTGQARFVEFVTLLDPTRMPNQRYRVLDWPYVEGLRLDEAMHPLTILSTGLYGRELLPQNGAPVRLVVPWKYGFKSIKSVVAIRLVDAQPRTTWNLANSDEYGFYSNVNPTVDHPRWSQARERRIGEYGLRDTLLFNGYAEQVGHLYAGMDLETYY